jgi:hypothetical protein
MFWPPEEVWINRRIWISAAPVLAAKVFFSLFLVLALSTPCVPKRRHAYRFLLKPRAHARVENPTPAPFISSVIENKYIYKYLSLNFKL